jgi:hypothetical protein
MKDSEGGTVLHAYRFHAGTHVNDRLSGVCPRESFVGSPWDRIPETGVQSYFLTDSGKVKKGVRIGKSAPMGLGDHGRVRIIDDGIEGYKLVHDSGVWRVGNIERGIEVGERFTEIPGFAITRYGVPSFIRTDSGYKEFLEVVPSHQPGDSLEFSRVELATQEEVGALLKKDIFC